MQRSVERILTTHVGSLIRPPDLVDPSSERHAAPPELDAARLRAAVADVVQRQVDAGIDVVNDGEYGKSGWSLYFLDRVTGFEIRKLELQPVAWLGRDLERFPTSSRRRCPTRCAASPSRPASARSAIAAARVARDVDNLRQAAGGAQPREIFMTSVAPASAAYNGVNEYYASERDYVFAIAEALREEYRAVHRAGFILQVDDALLANMYDTLVRQSPQRYREWAELRSPR